MPSVKEQIAAKANEIENIIFRYLPEGDGYNDTVVKAMEYTLSAGGKRLRPMLMDETFRMFGGEDRTIIEPFMAAIEMIHTYSLIHDDLPALDNDELRRGKPTAHIVFGEDMAILAGDALLNYAFEVAASSFREDEAVYRQAQAMKILTAKPGIFGMIGGQVKDVESSGTSIELETLMYIHKNKTAALIEASMMIGAILAGAQKNECRIIEEIAYKVGMAFQIQDDILDITSTDQVLGKPTGSDEKNEKMTYVSWKGLEQSREDVRFFTEDALALFDSLGYHAPFLRSLLLALASRES